MQKRCTVDLWTAGCAGSRLTAPARSPMDKPWTTLCVAHRLPTGRRLPTSSTALDSIRIKSGKVKTNTPAPALAYSPPVTVQTSGTTAPISNLDVALVKGHASVMLASMPILFIGFLFCDVEESISGVRKKAKESQVIAALVAIASLVFIGGFNHSIGRSSFAAFSLLSTGLTGLSAYCYRVAFCLATKK